MSLFTSNRSSFRSQQQQQSNGMFDNRPARNHFGLPPPSNASIFTNSISSVHHVGLVPYNGGQALSRRPDLSGRNSFFTTNGQALRNLNSNLAQPTMSSQSISSSIFGSTFTFTNQTDQPTPALSGRSSSIQALNNRLNPPLLNSNNNPPTSQPSIFGNKPTGTSTSAFSTTQPQPQLQTITVPSASLTDSKAPVQQNIPENNPSQPQNESASEEEEEEEGYEEEEPLENDPDSTTFAEDLQDLMASHQMMAPGDLFSNDTFTQNLVQFLKGFHIKVPRNKVLSRLPQEEPEAQINTGHQEEPVGKKEEPVQGRGIFQEIKTKAVTERLLPAKGQRFRSIKDKIKKHTYSVIPS